MLYSTSDFYRYSSGPQSETRSILLLGTSQDGPINFPTLVTNYAHAKSIFGEATEGNLLSSSRVIFDNIESDIVVYLMRVSGNEARYELRLGEDIGIGFRSYYGGKQYNNVFIVSDRDKATGEPYFFFFKDGVSTKPYYLNSYNSISDLCRDISEDSRRGNGWVLAFSNIPRQSPAVLEDLVLTELERTNFAQLSEGTDGTDICKDELYDALEESYELLSGFYCDVVVPIEAYFDDSYPMNIYGRQQYFNAMYSGKRDYLWVESEKGDLRRFHKQLVEFCEDQMRFGFMPHGVMGFYPVLDEKPYIEHPYSYPLARVGYSDLATRKGLSQKMFDKSIDKGYFMSVIMSDLYDTRDRHIPGYLLYAAMLVNLRDEDTTTNKVIPNREKYRLAYELESEEIEKLSELGVVTLRNSPKKGIVVSNGTTCAMPGTPFQWYSNIRQCEVVFAKIFESVKDLEGRSAPIQILSKEAESIAKAVLDGLKEQGIIKAYNISMNIPNRSELEIQLDIQPKYAVEFINLSGKVPIFT